MSLDVIPPPMTPDEGEAWGGWFAGRWGLEQSPTVLRGLWRRMRLLGVRHYREYFRLVTASSDSRSEGAALLEQVLNHESCFFRDRPSFDALTEHVLPELRATGPAELNLWSAGCSYGQEAYSLSMAGLEFGDPINRRVKVWGTDVSESALALARRGVYTPRDLIPVPEKYRLRYFRNGCEVGSELRRKTRFVPGNLNDATTLPTTRMHVIVCQNVLIYFAPQHRNNVARELTERLQTGGYLFLDPMDSFGLKVPGIDLVRFGDTIALRRRGFPG